MRGLLFETEMPYVGANQNKRAQIQIPLNNFLNFGQLSWTAFLISDNFFEQLVGQLFFMSDNFSGQLFGKDVQV